jgi:hypothetical protein
MKRTSHCIFFLLAASLLSEGATPSSRQDIVKSINSVIPEGWHTLDRGDGVWIVRKKPVRMVSFLAAIGGSKEPHPKTYQIVLSNADYISPADFPAMNEKNEKLKSLVEELRKEVMAIPHDIDKMRHPRDWEYRPRTKAEEDTILEYRKKSQQVRRLPNLYHGNHAFQLDMGFMLDTFDDKAEEKECITVLKDVLKLFGEYGKESDKAMDSDKK